MSLNPDPPDRKLRMALVGGAPPAFIGPVHVMAATLDGRSQLVAGAFSSNPAKSKSAAAVYGISVDRAYGSWRELLEGESRLDAEHRVDFISIATPNQTHFEMAAAALRAGFHVVCEKPMTTRLEDAASLVAIAGQTGRIVAIAHAYAGYPIVRQAREMVLAGDIGQVQAVRIQYIQGGLRAQQPGVRPARGAWKSDPALAGPSGTVADIGTHAFHLLRFVSGLAPIELSCQMRVFSSGRALEDYGHVVLRLPGGGLGTITCSQVTHGRLNDLSLEVDGTHGSLLWRQEDAERLVLRRAARPVQVYERNSRGEVMHEAARRHCRFPGGHPEGYLEAFANIYRAAFEAIAARVPADHEPTFLYPNVKDGWEGVQFVTQCIESHRNNAAWKSLSAEWPRQQAPTT